MSYDLDAVRSGIKPLSLEMASNLGQEFSFDEKDYFRFYGIDFEDKLEGVQHYFGSLKCEQINHTYEIATHYFAKTGATRSCFVVHGYLDHSGLFNKIINYLLHRGCNVVVFDLPGHGLSSGSTAEIDSFGDYVLVLRRVLEFFYQKIPSPWFAVAQSTGAAIVMDYLLSQQYDETTGPFDKVLLLAPLVRAKYGRMMRPAHWALKKFKGSVKRKFNDNSHDPVFMDFVRNKDPLQSKTISLRWVKAMLQWEKRYEKLSWVDQEVLVVQGEGDNTVAWQHNLAIIRNKFPRAKIYRIMDAGHHLACESDPYFERVTQAADIYFDRRLKHR